MTNVPSDEKVIDDISSVPSLGEDLAAAIRIGHKGERVSN
jgi:hypothetical protein